MPEGRVTLRPTTEEDLPDWVVWLNDPEVTEFTTLDPGATLEGERAWFAGITAPECTDQHWQIDAEGKHIGGCALTFEGRNQTAEFGIIIGDKTAWDKGYGTAALREVLRIGFTEFGLHRILLHVFAENRRGTRCYEKCGFRREGYHVESREKRGRWVDVATMAILREEWEEKEGRRCQER